MGEPWDVDKLLRKHEERRAAQVEIDANGRKAPKEIGKADAELREGEELSVVDRTWVHLQSGVKYVYEYPFRQLDREANTREACARFEGMARN